MDQKFSPVNSRSYKIPDGIHEFISYGMDLICIECIFALEYFHKILAFNGAHDAEQSLRDILPRADQHDKDAIVGMNSLNAGSAGYIFFKIPVPEEMNRVLGKICDHGLKISKRSIHAFFPV